jgi:type I restriction enzyme S subunit
MSSDLQAYQLDELCEFTNGFAFKSSDYVDASAETMEVFRMGYICRGGGFKEDSSPVFVPRYYGKNLDKFILKSGDVVIAMTDMKDKVAILGNTARIRHDNRFVLNQRAGCIRVKRRDLLDPDYFYFYSNSIPHVDYLRSRANSGVQVNLSTSAIKESQLLIPPLGVQISVASTLMALDDRITLLRETNTTLEAIAQTLFKSWFVDFDPVHAKMQGRAPEGMDEPTAALFPDSFEESKLGAVPKGWKFGSLSDICVIASGKRPAERSDVLSDRCKIPLYGGAGLMGYTSESLFEGKKIVTGRVGTLGRIHVAYPPCWASDNVLVLSPRDETFFSFSYQWLCGIDVHALNRGSTQPLLTQKDLGAQMAIIPPRTLLEKFEEISTALNEKIRLQTLQIETLANLRDTLLPRLISGQLSIAEAEEALS